MKYSIFSISYKLTLATSLLLPGCGQRSENAAKNSDLLVTDVEQSAVKRQSIGNCWLYATASWAESLHLSATHEEINISESYWTWWHFYNQLVDSGISTVNTGGSWSTAASIILAHGLVLEGEFLPAEIDAQMSAAQSQAEHAINAQLAAGGRLFRSADRTAANVRRELDLAFGSNMAAAEAISRSASTFIVGETAGTSVNLRSALSGGSAWMQEYYPMVYGPNTRPSSRDARARKDLLVRVMKALNDKKPVVMTLMIDFNGLDTEDAAFKLSALRSNGPGSQGGHMVVLEDYTVRNVPQFGTLGEGELSAEQKAAALRGQVTMLKAKNSWGTDRPERGLTDGYNRFMMDYLDAQWGWKSGEGDDASVFYYTTLQNFVLPPGY